MAMAKSFRTGLAASRKLSGPWATKSSAPRTAVTESSTGTPLLAAMLDDVAPIVDAVGVEPDQIVAFGRSVGSIYAIEAVHRYPGLRGLVLESGVHNVLERLSLRARPEELGCTAAQLLRAVERRLDHAAKLAGYTNPALILHAEKDNLVGVEHAYLNHRALGSAPSKKLLVRFPMGDHNSILAANAQAYMAVLARFLSGIGKNREGCEVRGCP